MTWPPVTHQDVQDAVIARSVIADVGTAGTATGDALRAVYGASNALTTVMDTLTEGQQSVAFTIIGDSTGYTSGKTRWPYIVTPWLASKFPGYAVQTRTWNDGNQSYDPPVVVQDDPTLRACVWGGIGALDHPGDPIPITGDIDVRVRLSLPAWLPGPTNTGIIACRWGTSQEAWRLYINSGGSAGQLTFEWSTNGSTSTAANSSVLTGVTVNTPLWVRATLTASSGAVNFYTSPDGITWTGAGTVSGSGATSIYDPGTAWPYELGAQSGGAFAMDSGTKLYEIEVRNGIGGESVVPRYPDRWAGHNSAVNYSFTGSPVLTVMNGSIPGASIGYLTDATRFPKLLNLSYGSVAVVLSCSHNDGPSTGYPYLALWDAWLASIRARTKAAEVAVTIQNPETQPGQALGVVAAHRQRAYELRSWAARNGLPTIDVYRAFVQSPLGLASLVEADGLHPTDATGSPLWAQKFEGALLGTH